MHSRVQACLAIGDATAEAKKKKKKKKKTAHRMSENVLSLALSLGIVQEESFQFFWSGYIWNICDFLID